MAKRRCARCPVLVDADAYRGLCVGCKRAWNEARGTREQRGYGAEFQSERTQWVHRIAAGEVVNCWRCGKRITGAFHLGHSDDRTQVNGPEHPLCNLKAAGRSSHP